MKNNVLPTEIANMIAAGEVVERPSSVVKELVENCIDAGATSITVEIKKGGIPYIRITDNGCGIEDVKKAMTPLFTTDTTGERSGMGFAVMQAFMDKLDVISKVNDGVRVVMTKYLR